MNFASFLKSKRGQFGPLGRAQRFVKVYEPRSDSDLWNSWDEATRSACLLHKVDPTTLLEDMRAAWLQWNALERVKNDMDTLGAWP